MTHPRSALYLGAYLGFKVFCPNISRSSYISFSRMLNEKLSVAFGSSWWLSWWAVTIRATSPGRVCWLTNAHSEVPWWTQWLRRLVDTCFLPSLGTYLSITFLAGRSLCGTPPFPWGNSTDCSFISGPVLPLDLLYQGVYKIQDVSPFDQPELSFCLPGHFIKWNQGPSPLQIPGGSFISHH